MGETESQQADVPMTGTQEQQQGGEPEARAASQQALHENLTLLVDAAALDEDRERITRSRMQRLRSPEDISEHSIRFEQNKSHTVNKKDRSRSRWLLSGKVEGLHG